METLRRGQVEPFKVTLEDSVSNTGRPGRQLEPSMGGGGTEAALALSPLPVENPPN